MSAGAHAEGAGAFDVSAAAVTGISEELLVAPQLSRVQLANAKLLGVKTVVNLRDMEREQDTIKDEKALVLGGGVAYHNFSIFEAHDMTPEIIREVVALIEKAEKPALIHCKVGLTACIAATCVFAKSQQVKDVDDVVAWGGDLGYDLAGDALIYNHIRSFLAEA